jgi:hypothetical protein
VKSPGLAVVVAISDRFGLFSLAPPFVKYVVDAQSMVVRPRD